MPGLSLILAAALLNGAPHGNVNLDEIVVFFPSLGRQLDDGDWEIEVRGWIFEPGSRMETVRAVGKLIGLKDNEAGELSYFSRRVTAFVVDNERRKRVVIAIGTRVEEMNRSDAGGHFSGKFQITTAEVDALTQSGDIHDGRLRFSAVLRRDDPRRFLGEAFLIAPTGLSVISDIDDTIKISDVHDHKSLLRNALIRPYEAVPGMAEQYQHWSSRGVSFHYVSASPWQLYKPLTEFLQRAGFPPGSFQLKRFRWFHNSAGDLYSDPFEYKVNSIRALLERYPNRRFILVGDSSEKDPEAYAALAKDFGRQVGGILIRSVAGKDAEMGRAARAFSGLPRDLWRVFDDAREIHDAIERIEKPGLDGVPEN